MDKLFEEFKAVRNKSVSVGNIPENKEGFRVGAGNVQHLIKGRQFAEASVVIKRLNLNRPDVQRQLLECFLASNQT